MNQIKGTTMNLIYWDMDGTLIDTGIAGRNAIEHIFRQHGKKEVPEIIISESGKTDVYICWHFYIALYQRVPTRQQLAEFCELYEEEIVRQMAILNASLLHNVQNILRELREKNNWMCLLFSGNRKNGVEKKLKLLHIDSYFDFENSVFGDSYFTKRNMAKDALKKSVEHWGENCQRVIVGDAPMDVVCGKIMGAKTISVATGAYGVEKLKEYNPDVIFPILPEANEFLRCLENNMIVK